METIELRLSNRFDFFKENKYLIDCILVFGENQYPCHRLILANFSSYFKDYFISMPNKKFNDVCMVKIDVNPNNAIQKVLDMIYNNYVEISAKEVPFLLKVVINYKFEPLIGMIRSIFVENSNVFTLLHYIQACIELDLPHEADLLSADLAKHLLNIYNNHIGEPFTIEMIYNAISPFLLASVLNQPILSHISGNQKIQYIDNFLLYKNIDSLSETDKEALSSCINWDDPLAYQFITKYPCNWVPSRIVRPLFSKLLKCRIGTLRAFNHEIQHDNDENKKKSVSRWYVLSWIQPISESKLVESIPEVDIVKFVQTFGGFTAPIDINKYGLLKLITSTSPLIKKYQIENIFDNDPYKYYLADGKGVEKPSIVVDFGKSANFHVSKISFVSTIPIKKDIPIFAPAPSPKGKILELKVSTDSNPKEVFLKTNDGVLYNYQITFPNSCSQIIFKLVRSSSSCSNIMRVQSIDACGYFSL